MNFEALVEEMMTIENLLALIIALCIAIVVGAVSYYLYRLYMTNSREQKFDRQFEDIFVSEFDEEPQKEKEKDDLSEKWNRYWKLRTRRAAISRYDDLDQNIPGRDAIVMSLIGGTLVGIFTFQMIIGVLAAIAIPVVYNVFLGLKINQIQASINSQVPAFLAGVKANIQASKTPQRSLLEVIDDIGDPLYSELLPVKQRIQSGVEMNEALEELKQRTTSRELQSLCGYIKLASTEGANLEKQIGVIQEVIAERQKVADRLASAARTARPAMLMGTLIIPAMFIIIYMFYEQARDFWFVDPISYVMLFLIIVLYAAGMWFTKMIVDRVKKM